MLTKQLRSKLNIVVLCLFTFTFAIFFNVLSAEAKTSEYRDHYELIVVGSDPEGIAAALSGARNGLDVLLVDTRAQVGGLMTQGWLNTIDMCYAYNPYGPKYDILNKGIFLEFFRQVEGDSFDVNTAQRVFDSMLLAEDDLDVLLNVKEITPLVKKDGRYKIIEAIEVKDATGNTTRYYCDRIIDATQDADIAVAAGVPYSVGMEDAGYPNRMMAVTLVFKLDGLTDEDWLTIRRTLNTDDSKDTGANNVSAWGFGDIMEQYQPTNPRVGIRGLNIGRQNDGSVLINALHVYNVNPHDPAALQEAKQLAERELPHIVNFIRENVPGFANATLGGVAPELYVRESRHIYGEYRLTIDDVLENRDFEDRIAFGSYPVDVQATGPDKKGYVIGKPLQYAIPFRCIVPKEIDNLLVVGRSASFDSLAHGSARVIPVGMATGEAAGAAAALSLEEDVLFREMAYKNHLIRELQKMLNKQGMVLEPFSFKNRLANHWAYEDMKFVRQFGLARGGYANDYRFDELMPLSVFVECITDLAGIYGLEPPKPVETEVFNECLKDEYAEEILTQYDQSLKKENWNDKVLEVIEENDGYLTYGAVYVLLRDFVLAISN